MCNDSAAPVGDGAPDSRLSASLKRQPDALRGRAVSPSFSVYVAGRSVLLPEQALHAAVSHLRLATEVRVSLEDYKGSVVPLLEALASLGVIEISSSSLPLVAGNAAS